MFYKPTWWKEAVGYQIYLKSFKDSNNDGIGDLNGIREKLPYLKDLGITLIWICPFYKSPMDDNGYDVADFFDIDPSFGTLDDMKLLIKDAHKLGIRIIADFVMNHTSDEHAWFIESRKSKDNPYRDYYIWADGKIVDGVETPPTNWASFFGGSCWKKDILTNQYYMKIFSNKMPDLNYKNPKVRQEMMNVAAFWLDLGIDGFRIDAVAHLGRKDELIDSTMDTLGKYKPDWRMFSNLPVIFDYLREFKEHVFDKYNIVTIGEVGGGATPEEALRYSGLEEGSLNMVFNFDHCWSNNVWDLTKKEQVVVDLVNLKKNFRKWQYGLYGKAWTPIYWLNHDHPRLISQYGDPNNIYLSGSMLGSSLYFMWGTPFVYQGEEIGMTNYPFRTIDDFNDVQDKNNYYLNDIENSPNKDEYIYLMGIKSRDNARTIMSWDSSKYAGFSNVKPWFNILPNHKEYNVKKALEDEKSIYKHYREIFKLRANPKYKDTLIYGSYKQLLPRHKDVYAYVRIGNKKILTVSNFFNKDVNVSIRGYKVKKVLLSNYDNPNKALTNLTLRPYETITYLVE